jgi:hypothetical protein
LENKKGVNMDAEVFIKEDECRKGRNVSHDGACSAVYGLGFIGACVYFISTAATFWLGVLGFLKALVWPAFLVYAALKYLGL